MTSRRGLSVLAYRAIPSCVSQRLFPSPSAGHYGGRRRRLLSARPPNRQIISQHKWMVDGKEKRNNKQNNSHFPANGLLKQTWSGDFGHHIHDQNAIITFEIGESRIRLLQVLKGDTCLVFLNIASFLWVISVGWTRFWFRV